METAFLALVVGLTSAAAYLLGTAGRRWPPQALPAAAARVLECVGLTLVFFAANVGLALVLLLAARRLGGRASVYLANDVALLVLSALQALVVAWWQASPAPPGND